MQAFKTECLADALRRDPKSQQFLGRRDFLVLNTGFATSGRDGGKRSRLADITKEDRSVRQKLEQNMAAKEKAAEA